MVLAGAGEQGRQLPWHHVESVSISMPAHGEGEVLEAALNMELPPKLSFSTCRSPKGGDKSIRPSFDHGTAESVHIGRCNFPRFMFGVDVCASSWSSTAPIINVNFG